MNFATRHQRNMFIRSAAAILCVACIGLLLTGQAARAIERPNIVVFLVDDMGVMDTSVAMLPGDDGRPKTFPLNKWYRTPNMQRLAKQGVRFSDFYAQSVCSPTRVSIMTGQNATRHGTTTWIQPGRNNRGRFGPSDWNWEGLDKNDVTLPRLLTQAGYRTIHVGKAHFGPKRHPGADPTNLGFDVNVGGTTWGRPRTYYGQKNYGNPPVYKNPHHNVPDLKQYHGTDTYLTEALTIEANKCVTQAVEDGKPFFLNMAHYAVHAPFNPDPRFASHYKSSGKSGRAQAYATMIEGVDKSLGDILDHLEKLGVAENTLVFFLGDNGSDAPLGSTHGVASSSPLRAKKGTHYEGGMRVPFIAAWAKPKAGHPVQQRLAIAQNSFQPASIGTVMDLFPTIVNLVGVDPPSDYTIDGRDLAPRLTGKPTSQAEQSFLMHFPHNHRSSYFTSLRLGDWKLIYHYQPKKPGKHRYELFNLAKDRSESNNLAQERPKQLRRMVKQMRSRLESQNAQYPVGADGEKTLKPQLPQ
jgi:arylsulfatase A-like enzyme